MDSLLYHLILLAQRSRLDSLSSGFRGRRARLDTDDIVIALLILGGIALAIWILSYVLKLQERRRAYTSPLGLFLSLCKAHRLRWSERWLLWRVAQAQRLRDPARLFLEPERLQLANLSRSLRIRASQLEQIRDRLFARPEEAQQQQDSQPLEMPDYQHAGTPLPPVPPTQPWTSHRGQPPQGPISTPLKKTRSKRKALGNLLPERPEGCCAQKVPGPFSQDCARSFSGANPPFNARENPQNTTRGPRKVFERPIRGTGRRINRLRRGPIIGGGADAGAGTGR